MQALFLQFLFWYDFSSVARSNPVPQREKEIGQRLRRFRHLIVLNRVELAKELEIGVPRLASYESGQVPLPYQIAKRLDYGFGVNFEWLATGAGDPRQSISIGGETDARIPVKTTFSRAFDLFIAPALLHLAQQPKSQFQQSIAKLKGVQVEVLPAIGMGKKSTMKAVAAKSFGAHIDQLPPFLYWEFYRKLQSASDEFLQSHAQEIASFDSLELNPEKPELTNDSPKGNTVGVKSELEMLMARVKRQAAKPGAKAKLARFLDVAPARITEWLNDNPEMRKEPGGNYTLRLLRWVEQQERQK